MADQSGQQLAGLRMVMAGLAAAEGVGEGVEALDGAGDEVLIETRKELMDELKLKGGGQLSEILENLKKCDFIRKYATIGKSERDNTNKTLYAVILKRSGNLTVRTALLDGL